MTRTVRPAWPARGAAADYPRAFRRRAAGVQAPAPSIAGSVTEADLGAIPPAAARYLRFRAVVGRPRTRAVRASMHGRFRTRPGGRWLACRAWQYDTVAPITRLFRMRIGLAPGLAMTGWDTYLDGHGRMRGTLLGFVPVVGGRGAEFDTSELVTWLNDAVLLAPAMLLDPAVRCTDGADADSFGVEVTDAGRTVRAQVLVDAGGAPRDFWTDDRYAALPGGPVRARWRTPVGGWTVEDGSPQLAGARAEWELPGGPFSYAEFDVDDVVTDPQPWRSG